MTSVPKIISTTELSAQDAKWITLQKIKYSDAEGKERLWECAERKTRKSSGVDAVSVLALIDSKTNAFPLSTVIIEQFRPPVGKFVVGLIDEGESPETAAVRELEEETGFKAYSIFESSDIVVSDPGMTSANMKLVIANVLLDDKLELPEQKLEAGAGEFIKCRVVDLDKLHDELKGEYGFIVDARLSHLATGFTLAQQFRIGLA
ncbi:hypothetical protein AGABI2DRAFT_148835 [Agaricus bisporus var. bisporus H97]|uniref:hypothetical protein n=1 Tax=Agaricus bisporus var. bisporus (strain H97 / ATCC MYA-4626 / FGSC 10389) TaxID=936046 RepID=UPI00029F76FC|nr:hypothetical protein AGABI2DRAFT_148835 [Agaricus bisporus var. bisporus H97]EKV50286.1 hypothetical protein AGABI2DRAFT_148835 [Agaricus bisporus var. bisporus H97]